MPLQTMCFEEGEEKLSLAWDQIGLLWQSVLTLKARADIDGIAINALLRSGGSAERARDIWQQESSAWMATHSLETRDKSEFELATRQMNERAAFWDEQFESLPWSGATHRH